MTEALIFVISFIASFLFALGGVGAAIILIPILVSLGIPINTARPAGLFYNTVSMAGASYHNIKHKRLDFKVGIPLILSSFFFAVVGAWVSPSLPSRLILLLFIAFLLFSSGMFFLHRKKAVHQNRTDTPYISLSLTGALAGLLSGLLGVGGGGIISPLMLMLGYSPKKIASITAFVVPFSSFSAFLTYWTMGHVDWRLMLIVSTGGMAGAVLGTRVMHNHLNPQTVKKILGIILLGMAIKLIFKL